MSKGRKSFLVFKFTHLKLDQLYVQISVGNHSTKNVFVNYLIRQFNQNPVL